MRVLVIKGRNRFFLLGAIGAAFLSGACGAPVGKPGPPPPASVVGQGPAGPVRVSLLWSEAVDLDLYVTDPAHETLYFANNPSGSGGRLERDVACKDARLAGKAAVLSEAAGWTARLPGHYRVGVDFPEVCDSKLSAVSFRVLAEVDGKRIERTGTLQAVVFEPVVLEFDLSPVPGEQSTSATQRE
jgi:hypothetical protein